VDFALSEGDALTHLIECKLADNTVHRALAGFAEKSPQIQAVQLVRDLRQEEFHASVQIVDAACWLAELAA
jgi:hypothetical protein